MSLEKSVKHGKEHRKPYYGSKRFDWSCRPHGGCTYCLRNRLHRHVKRIAATEVQDGQSGG